MIIYALLREQEEILFQSRDYTPKVHSNVFSLYIYKKKNTNHYIGYTIETHVNSKNKLWASRGLKRTDMYLVQKAKANV
jgi:hypothetical protein